MAATSGLLSSARLTSGLVWGFDFIDGRAHAIHEPEPGTAVPAGVFRWLHFNTADRGTERWIEQSHLAKRVADLLLSQASHQQALIEGDQVACVLHDFEREFDPQSAGGTGALRFFMGPGLIVSARKHALCCADVVREHIQRGNTLADPAAGLDLLTSAIAEVMTRELRNLEAEAEKIEDELLADNLAPDNRQLMAMRRRALRLHRLLTGHLSVCRQLEKDSALPAPLLPAIEKFGQRTTGLDQGVIALQSQLRLLRDELDLQAAQHTNRSLYVLSILSALMLPATLVTGLFGMNTGGLPWATDHFGTLIATTLAVGSAFVVYLILRFLGYVRL